MEFRLLAVFLTRGRGQVTFVSKSVFQVIPFNVAGVEFFATWCQDTIDEFNRNLLLATNMTD